MLKLPRIRRLSNNLNRILKCTLIIGSAWILFVLFYPGWKDIETLEHFKSMQRKLENSERISEAKIDGEPTKKYRMSLNNINSIGNNNGYKNSLTLQEKLKPKLNRGQPELDKNGDVFWDDLGAAKSNKDIEIREEGYRLFAFNSLVSSRIGFKRDVPDTRHPECKKLEYPSNLPTASVIICFYHEELMTLLRTVHSIIDRTPKQYLKEILLINDRSDIDISSNVTAHLKEHNLDDVVRIIHAPERLGLIRARILGSREARGDVIVFLDSHVEVNVQWLEPLISRIQENKKNVVTPIIDIISADTFKYDPSPLVRGGFNWGLNFKWDPITREELQEASDFAKPMKSPTMAGGLFAMDRKYFNQLGEYDNGLDVWGGENLEISFRIWMCGGNLEIIPCSRVGHVFRKRRPYGANSAGEDSMVRNSLRVAHVWMDDFIENYFKVNPKARTMEYGNVSPRIDLRKRLGCKSFQWYLDNIYPEFDQSTDAEEKRLKKKHEGIRYEPWNMRSRNYVQHFMLRLADTKLCVRSAGEATVKKSELVLAPCMRSTPYIWSETDKAELVLSELLCLDSSSKNKIPRLMKCHELRNDQEWKFKNESRTAIYNMAAGLCLDTDGRRAGSKLILDVCSSDKSMMWELLQVKDEL